MPTLSLVEPSKTSPSTQSQKRDSSDLQGFRVSSTFDHWRMMDEDRNASLTARGFAQWILEVGLVCDEIRPLGAETIMFESPFLVRQITVGTFICFTCDSSWTSQAVIGLNLL